MAQVKLGMLHDAIVEMVLNAANPAMPMSEIIKELGDIKNKKEEDITPDDARNMQYIAVELIRISRDIMARLDQGRENDKKPRRVVHKKYGAGNVIDHAFIGPVPVTYVKFDLQTDEAIIPDSELEQEIKERDDIDNDDKINREKKLEEIRANSLEEIKEINKMNNESLIEDFEFIIRNGAGPSSRRVVFVKRELLNRMS